jgi:hypothetical protein
LVSFLLAFPPKSYIHSFSSSFSPSCPVHLIILDFIISVYIWRRVQLMKLVIMHISLTSYQRDGSVLIKCTILPFTWRVWGKPRRISVR